MIICDLNELGIVFVSLMCLGEGANDYLFLDVVENLRMGSVTFLFVVRLHNVLTACLRSSLFGVYSATISVPDVWRVGQSYVVTVF